MTTLKKIDLTCPNCDHDFASAIVDKPFANGRRRTDFQIETNGVPSLPFGVHLCGRCGFAGPAEWFADSTEVNDTVRRRVWDELTPRVASASVSASEKYEFAAKVAAWDGASRRDIAELWLRAAWCCVHEYDVEAERYYRLKAVRMFEECLEDYDGVLRDERAAITYLVGELWRRIGDTAKANRWFDRVPLEITQRAQQAWLLQWARQQQRDPREWLG